MRVNQGEVTYFCKQKEKVAARNQHDYVKLRIHLHVIFQCCMPAAQLPAVDVTDDSQVYVTNSVEAIASYSLGHFVISLLLL